MSEVRIEPATGGEADALLDVISTAFGSRPPLDPPAPALAETAASLGAALDTSGGLVVRDGDRVVGGLVFEDLGDLLALRRVCLRPERQHHGTGALMVAAAEGVAHDRGREGVQVAARVELPETVHFWQRLGYSVSDRNGPNLTLTRLFPTDVDVGSAEATRDLARSLAAELRAGDLVILTGDLGAGKTTFAQGLGEGLGVRGPVTSPTFVIARVHPALRGGPPLVHVDAYRLSGLDELDDLDLDTSLDEAVTVVEWGEGLAEGLAEDRLEIALTRTRGAVDSDLRHVRLSPVGERWRRAGLGRLLDHGLA